MSDLDQLERLLDEATPGPWEPACWYGSDAGGWAARGPHHRVPDEHEVWEEAPGSPAHTKATADAALIVAMREALPGLIAEVRAGREATFRLRSIAHRLRAITPGPNSGSLSAEDYMDRVESMLTDAESRGLTRGRAEGLAAAADVLLDRAAEIDDPINDEMAARELYEMADAICDMPESEVIRRAAESEADHG